MDTHLAIFLVVAHRRPMDVADPRLPRHHHLIIIQDIRLVTDLHYLPRPRLAILRGGDPLVITAIAHRHRMVVVDIVEADLQLDIHQEQPLTIAGDLHLHHLVDHFALNMAVAINSNNNHVAVITKIIVLHMVAMEVLLSVVIRLVTTLLIQVFHAEVRRNVQGQLVCLWETCRTL